jgi:L-malate glycosyltransferase
MGKRKIMIYYEQLGYGGVDTHLAHLINNWPKSDDQFVIISNPDNEGLSFLEQMLQNPSVTIRILDNLFERSEDDSSKFIRYFAHFKIQLLFIRMFKKMIAEELPDILLSNNGGYPGGMTNWLAAIIGKKNKTTQSSTFLLVHHAPTATVSGIIGIYTKLLAVWVQYLEIPIITVSQASKNMLERHTPIRDINVIYNGIVSNKTTPHPLDFFSKYGIEHHKTIIGMIGPIDAHKGHSTILQVLNKSVPLRKTVHFVIVGRGKDNQVTKLKKMIREYGLDDMVTFTGFLPGDSHDIISGFDLLVMPTIDFEGFGYSMAEAMLAEIPVVASRVGAIPEVIIDRESGFLIDASDIQGWKTVLEKLVQNPTLRKQIGITANESISNQFSADKMSKNYYNLLVNDHI